jgi:hypothetical protein
MDRLHPRSRRKRHFAADPRITFPNAGGPTQQRHLDRSPLARTCRHPGEAGRHRCARPGSPSKFRLRVLSYDQRSIQADYRLGCQLHELGGGTKIPGH